MKGRIPMKKSVSALLTLAAAFVLVVLPNSITVHAQCSNATLTGTYAMIWSGFTTKKAPVGNEVPFAGTGVVTFDGAGNASVSVTFAINGVISTNLTGSGPYTVNPDCTGSWAVTSGDLAGFTSSLVMIGGGAEVFGVDTAASSGTTVSFDLKKQ
jgi:hypothetical protein